MKPVVREYSNDETLQRDVEQLKSLGVAREDIYVLSHDDDRTERIAENADANTIGPREVGLKHAVGNIFSKRAMSSEIKSMKLVSLKKKLRNLKNI